jgi:Tfp pilus assembly protein PilN
MLAVGTGVGLEIAGQDLRVTVSRVRPGGIRILGSTVIAGFRQRPAAEWGGEYAGFLRRLGASHLAATVLLPRSELIVRQLTLPGVADRDLASAIQFQVDSLHPYPEDDARYAWARLPGTPAVLIGIAHRAVIDRYSSLLIEAGIKVAAFSFSAAILYSARRILAAPTEQEFLAIGGAGPEAYGESAARPVFSALLDPPWERTASLAAAELRLPPESSPVPLEEVLPKPKYSPPGYDLSQEALSYATSLAGACPRLALRANLLPEELRSTSSRMIFVPSIALAAILLALAATLAGQSALEQRRQLSLLGAEIQRLEPQARRAEAVERSVEQMRRRTQLLDSFRGRTGRELEALNELTRLLAPPAWLTELALERDNVTLAGQAEQAAPLLKLIDSSPLFQNSEFVGQIGKADKNEVFRIRAAREGVAP